MKYKVNDRVRIKSFEWYNENKNEFGDVKVQDNVFTPYMSRFCGQEVTIYNVIVIDSSCDNACYEVIENEYYWTDDMLEGLAGSELNEPQDND